MEQNSDVVLMGQIISESTYKRKNHEIQIDDIAIDFFDNKTKTIHEIKKSDKMEETHIWQVKHYINVLEMKGIEGVKGKIDYPKLRETKDVELTNYDKKELQRIELEIEQIIAEDIPPSVIDKPFCKKCSYFDLCYV